MIWLALAVTWGTWVLLTTVMIMAIRISGKSSSFCQLVGFPVIFTAVILLVGVFSPGGALRWSIGLNGLLLALIFGGGLVDKLRRRAER